MKFATLENFDSLCALPKVVTNELMYCNVPLFGNTETITCKLYEINCYFIPYNS